MFIIKPTLFLLKFISVTTSRLLEKIIEINLLKNIVILSKVYLLT